MCGGVLRAYCYANTEAITRLLLSSRSAGIDRDVSSTLLQELPLCVYYKHLPPRLPESYVFIIYLSIYLHHASTSCDIARRLASSQAPIAPANVSALGLPFILGLQGCAVLKQSWPHMPYVANPLFSPFAARSVCAPRSRL